MVAGVGASGRARVGVRDASSWAHGACGQGVGVGMLV